MARPSKLLTNELINNAKASLQKVGKFGLVANRLNIIIASGKHGMTEVARINDISRTTLIDWIKRFSNGGYNALINKPKKAKSPLCGHYEDIKKWIESNSTITAKELVIKIREELEIETSMSSIYRLLKKLKFSYITPRPRHYKQNISSIEEFKKKSSKEDSVKPGR